MWHLTHSSLVGTLTVFAVMILVSPLSAASPSSEVQVQFDVPPEGRKSEVTSNPTGSSIPFAGQEQALKYSDSWKKMTLEEQEEALAKIQHYREIYRQRQAELWERYKPLTEGKPKKKSFLSRRRSSIPDFDDFWAKWQELSSFRQQQVVKRWGVESGDPLQLQPELQERWSQLSRLEKRQLMRDFQSAGSFKQKQLLQERWSQLSTSEKRQLMRDLR